MNNAKRKINVMNHPITKLGIMVCILLASYLMGVQGLNADAIWFDELTTIGHTGVLTGPFSPIDVVESLSQISQKHTPLYFQLLSLWGDALGIHQLTLRTLSLFFGVLAIAWVYRVGKDVGGWRVGIWSAIFLGLNVFWIEYYHELRMYSLQIALVMMVIWHYLFLSHKWKEARKYHWVGLIGSGAALLYTQPFSIFVFVAIGLYHLLFVQKDRRWLSVTGAFLLMGVLYLPWLPVTYVGMTTRVDTISEQMPFDVAVQTFLRLFSNGAAWLLIVPFAVALNQLRDKKHRLRIQPIWILGIFILVMLFVVNEVFVLIPMRRSRYFLISWGMWAIVIGVGLAYLRYQWIAVALAVVFVFSGFAFRDAEDYQDYQGTIFAVNFYPPMQDYVDELRGITQPHDFVVGFTDANFVNRRGKHGLSTGDYYMQRQLGTGGTFIPTHFNEDDLEVDIPEKLANHPYLLLTYNPQEMPRRFDVIMNIIERDYIACDMVIDKPDLFVQRYIDNVIGCDHEYAPIVYDNGVTIVDKFIEYDLQDNTVQVVTGWQVDDDRLLDEYNVSIQIVTPDWQNVGQTDRHLYDDILKWYRAELSTDQLPAGDYRVMAIVYDRETGEKVNGTDLTTDETGNILPIAIFTVEE